MQERVRRAFGSHGGDPISAISDEIVPVVLVDDVRDRDITVAGIRRYLVSGDFTAVAEPFLSIYNPDPKTKVRIDWFSRFNATPVPLWIRRAQGAQGTTVVNAAFMGFEPGAVVTVNPVGVATFTQADVALVASVGGGFLQFSQGASQSPIPLGFILGLNDRVDFTTGAVGTLIITLSITEFSVEP